jgi:hypothetical protein
MQIRLLALIFLLAPFNLHGQTVSGSGMVAGSGTIAILPPVTGGLPTGGPPSASGWNRVLNTAIGSTSGGNNICPPDNFGGAAYAFTQHCKMVVGAWSSAIADTGRNVLWLWGGGHSDYFGNEFYQFDMAAQTMRRFNNPTTPIGDSSCQLALAGGTVPNSRHNYNSMVYVAHLDWMFVMQGVVACNSGGGGKDVWVADLGKLVSGSGNPWTRKADFSENCTSGVCYCAYDPNSRKVFCDDRNSLFEWTPETDTWVSVSNAVSDNLHFSSIIDPVHKFFVKIGGGFIVTADISNPASVTEVDRGSPSGCSALQADQSPGLTFDTRLQKIVGRPSLGAGGTVWIYDPVANSCTTQTFSTNAPPDPCVDSSSACPNSTGDFNRFAYFPAYDAYVLVNDGQLDARTLRLQAKVTPAGLIGDCTSEHSLYGRTDVLYCEPFTASTWWQNKGYVNSTAKTNPTAAVTADFSNVSVLSGSNCVLGLNCIDVAMTPNSLGALSVLWPTKTVNCPNSLNVPGGNGTPCQPDELYVRYYFFTAANFNPNQYDASGVEQGTGGKFPGVGDPRDSSDVPSGQCGNGGNPSDGINCWSARVDYRNCLNACTNTPGTSEFIGTRIGSYLYFPDQQGATGNNAEWDQYTWGQSGGTGPGSCTANSTNTNCGFLDTGDLIPGTWHLVEMYYKMNTAGQTNGIIRGWVDNHLGYEKTNIQFRKVGNDNLHVRLVWLNVFKGGTTGNGPASGSGCSTPGFCPPYSVRIDHLVVATSNRIGPNR